MPEYVVLGRNFELKKKGRFSDTHTGRIIASRDAVYIVIWGSVSELMGGGGLIGGLVSAATGALSDQTVREQARKLSDLPREVTQHPDWPLPPSYEYPVIVVPRDEVRKIRYRWWSTFDIFHQERTYCIGGKFFGRGKAFRQMLEWGWKC